MSPLSVALRHRHPGARSGVHQIPEVPVDADGSPGQGGQGILRRTAGETC